MATPWTRLKRYPALLLLIIVYVAACVVVIGNVIRGSGGAPGTGQKKVLRFAHWQLEPGIRNAVDALIADYEETHPDVEVRQILIPEEGYFRWVNTQLIGRTAPDMIECGLGGPVAWSLWPKFYARYFLPLDRYVEQPNPYNKGTQFENTPWRQTYFDEMDGGYEDTLQSYYRVPLSAFTVRLYYNKDMIDEVWGETFPATYEEFIELCEKLVEHGEQRGRELVPIAGSGYNFRQFFQTYQAAMTAPYLDRLDADYDGSVSRVEAAARLYSGQVQMTEAPIRANFELVRELSDYFPQGFMQLDRDEAVFLFLQGYSAMITTGSWDYQSLGVQSEFQIGIAEIPLPSKDNPRYGRHVAGPRTEAGIRGGFPMAITRFSENAEQALDFLQYASSLKKNEELNQAMYWIPAIRDAEMRKELKPFAPRIEGYSTALNYDGPGVELAYNQALPLYLSGKISYEDFAEGLYEAYRRDAPHGVREFIRNNEQTLAQQMRFAAVRRAAIAGAPGAEAAMSGDSELQYKSLIEVYVTQVASRANEIRVWAESAAESAPQTPEPE